MHLRLAALAAALSAAAATDGSASVTHADGNSSPDDAEEAQVTRAHAPRQAGPPLEQFRIV
jgi:hypothetical protein